MSRRFWPVFDRVLDLLAALAGLILVFIVTAVCYTVARRYLFTQTTICCGSFFWPRPGCCGKGAILPPIS
jgi:hypothetical protein